MASWTPVQRVCATNPELIGLMKAHLEGCLLSCSRDQVTMGCCNTSPFLSSSLEKLKHDPILFMLHHIQD